MTLFLFRNVVLSLMITAADLCHLCKPFESQKESMEQLYEEFYHQGDKEKEMGVQLHPMMDRTKLEDQPINQVCKHIHINRIGKDQDIIIISLVFSYIL